MTAVGPAAGRSSTVASLLRDDAAWDAFVAGSPAPSHLQVTAWARAKAANGWRPLRVVADGGSGPIGAQVLVRRLGPGPFSLGYAARGPIVTSLDAVSVAAFTRALRRAARHHRLTHVSVDPALEGDVPAHLLREAGWLAADAVQHDRSRLIDLTRPEEDLWADLRSTARRYVTKARNLGITVREGGADDLEAFYAIMVETADRSGFIHRSMRAYRDTFAAFAPAGMGRLLLADLPDGTPAAAKMLLSCGGRVTQPYSGMTRAAGDTRANYLLEWETIRRSAAAGERVYDMWGLATPGIAQFKAGFGGREVSYAGTWDLVTLPFLRAGLVRARRAYVRLARRRRGLDPGGEARGPSRPEFPRPHDG